MKNKNTCCNPEQIAKKYQATIEITRQLYNGMLEQTRIWAKNTPKKKG